MVWIRIVAAISVFFAGWYAVEKAMPGTLPRGPFSSHGLHVSTASDPNWPIEVFEGSFRTRSVEKATKPSDHGNTAHQDSAQSQESSGKGHSHGSSDARGVTLARRLWSHAELLCECVCRAVDFLTGVSLPESNSTALQQIAGFWELGHTRTWLVVLTPVLLTIVVVKWYCGGVGNKMVGNMAETQRKSHSLPCRPVDERASFISLLSHQTNRVSSASGLSDNGQCIDQANRELTAAVVIQRWVRGEFKRRGPYGVPCCDPNESSSDAREYIDRDDGAILPTVLEDIDLNVTDSHLSADTASSSDGALVASQAVTGRVQGEIVETRPAPRCRIASTLSSAQLSASLLRFAGQAGGAARHGSSQPQGSKN